MLTLSDDQSHPIDLNWAYQMKKFFKVLNKAELWLRRDPEEIRDNIKSLTGELEDYYFKEDHNRMVNSSFAPLYRLIDYGQGGILAMGAPIQMMRILHQARVGNIQTIYFWLNGSGHKINPKMVCNKYEKENLVHILNVCPIYNALREVYLRDSIENVENFWDILRPLNLQKLRSLYNFIGGALRLRSFIINE